MKNVLIAAAAGAAVVYLAEQVQAYADRSATGGFLQNNARYLGGGAALVLLHHFTKAA